MCISYSLLLATAFLSATRNQILFYYNLRLAVVKICVHTERLLESFAYAWYQTYLRHEKWLSSCVLTGLGPNDYITSNL